MAGSAVEMFGPKNYDKTDLYEYLRQISKLMYLLYRTRPNIAFAVSQLSRHNVNS